MAQRNTHRLARLKRLLRRFGLSGGRAAAVACLVLVAVFGSVGLARGMVPQALVIEREGDHAQKGVTGQEETKDEPASTEGEEREPLVAYVHVDGAVAQPGMYCIEGTNPRVNDAVDLAGGLTAEADTTSLNLAAPILDGQKIHVPARGEEPVAAANGPAVGESNIAEETARININTANGADLQRLPGVGESTASAIIEDREQNGPFASVEDLMRVSGIGEKKLQKMRDMIDV